MYNHISAYYANKNTQEGYKEAIYYLELTVQKENEALEVVKSERYEEILNDICEDCAHAIALCHHVGEFQKAGWFYDENVRFLMCLATVKPDKYEILLANKALESAAFKMKYLPEAEGSAELLSVAYALSLKHPELDDMQKLLEKIIKK